MWTTSLITGFRGISPFRSGASVHQGARQLVYVFPIIGGCLGTIVLISICAAVLALRTLDNQWQDLAIEHKERLPEMTGGGSKLAMRLGHFAQLGVPAGIVVAWLYIYEQIPL